MTAGLRALLRSGAVALVGLGAGAVFLIMGVAGVALQAQCRDGASGVATCADPTDPLHAGSIQPATEPPVAPADAVAAMPAMAAAPPAGDAIEVAPAPQPREAALSAAGPLIAATFETLLGVDGADDAAPSDAEVAAVTAAGSAADDAGGAPEADPQPALARRSVTSVPIGANGQPVMTARVSRAPASSAATAAAAEAAYGQNGRSPAAQPWEIEPLGFAAAPGLAAESVETVPDLEAPQPRARPQLSPPQATDRVRVGSSAVNVRSGPGGSNGRLFVLAAGAEVRTTHAEDSWVRIEDEGGRTGWVYASYLVDAVLDGLPGAEDVAVAAAPSAPPAATPAQAPAETAPAASAETRTVLGQGVNVRAAPAGSGERLFALRGGIEVRILEARGGWLRVTDPEGRSGWVYSRFLSGS